MTRLNPGDRVVCKLHGNTLVNTYNSNYDNLKTFDIIAADNMGYYLYVPPYTYIKDMYKVDSFILKNLDLHKKYLGDNIVYITSVFVHKIASQIEGTICDKCKEFCYKAMPNQPDNGFTCYLCRDNPYR